MSIERLAKQGATYSSAVGVSAPGRWVYVSGQIATGGTMAEQAAGCFDRIEDALREFRASLEHVVRVTAYLTSLDDYAEYSRIRGERFGDAPPASAAVQVAGLLESALVEVDAVAFVPDSPT